MLFRKRTGSVLCPSCGRLVGVSDDKCLNCGRLRPGMFGLTKLLAHLGRDMGFVQAVIGGCSLLYIAALAMDPQGITNGGLFSLLSPSTYSLLRLGSSGAYPVFGLHHWWTPLSAGWLHGGLLHIGFNLYWVRFLAPQTAEMYGPSRMVVIYSVSSITGFLASSTMGLLLPHAPLIGGAMLTCGASAPILGLLGALVYYGRRSGSRQVGSQAWSYALLMIVYGFFMSRVDNWAHIGGFAGGYLAGRVLDPLKPERGDHVLAAIACLVLTVGAILASILTVPPG
jgi:rhomboid protease GluP